MVLIQAVETVPQLTCPEYNWMDDIDKKAPEDDKQMSEACTTAERMVAGVEVRTACWIHCRRREMREMDEFGFEYIQSRDAASDQHPFDYEVGLLLWYCNRV